MQQRMADRSMPISRNRVRFFLTWLRREAASRCCVSVMMAAVRSSNFSRICPVSHSDRISAEVAVRSWQTVSSGFFFPPLLVYLDEEQMADSSQDQVAAIRHEVDRAHQSHCSLLLPRS